jgi:hypothetical protein
MLLCPPEFAEERKKSALQNGSALPLVFFYFSPEHSRMHCAPFLTAPPKAAKHQAISRFSRNGFPNGIAGHHTCCKTKLQVCQAAVPHVVATSLVDGKKT